MNLADLGLLLFLIITLINNAILALDGVLLAVWIPISAFGRTYAWFGWSLVIFELLPAISIYIHLFL